MEFIITQVIKALVFPPGIFIVLMITSLWLLKHNIKAAKRTLIFTVCSLYFLSLPIVSELLITPLEPYPALNEKSLKDTSAEAIVILSAGRLRNATEYDNKDVAGDYTFGRLRYGVKLHNHTKLPILVTGGLVENNQVPLAQLMSKDLHDNFGINTAWQENQSTNTAENAKFSYEILSKEKIQHIFLVSDAWHMSRAVSIFEKQGFVVTPAPTRFRGLNDGRFDLELAGILPSANALILSYFALHEFVGTVWYKIRY